MSFSVKNLVAAKESIFSIGNCKEKYHLAYDVLYINDKKEEIKFEKVLYYANYKIGNTLDTVVLFQKLNKQEDKFALNLNQIKGIYLNVTPKGVYW